MIGIIDGLQVICFFGCNVVVKEDSKKAQIVKLNESIDTFYHGFYYNNKAYNFRNLNK